MSIAKPNLWIRGTSRSGKSTALIQHFNEWTKTEVDLQENPQIAAQSVLVLSVNSEQRQVFSDRFMRTTQAKYPVIMATPRSFMRDQVILFFPLLIQTLSLKAQFPILLRIENEQELAGEVWQEAIAQGHLAIEGLSNERLVRRLLDLYLLAANAGKDLAEIPEILERGLGNPNLNFQAIGTSLMAWRDFCWQHSFLTYGIITELFGRYLLPHPFYRKKLLERFGYLLVDDADEYPAIACDFCEFLLKNQVKAAFSFNPEGSIRLGLGADPDYWQRLANSCKTIELSTPIPSNSIQAAIPLVLELVNQSPISNPSSIYQSLSQPIETWNGFYSISTIARAKLFRKVAEVICEAVQTDQVAPQDIAIIAPGLDQIANYALTEILQKQGIDLLPLHDQRPLSLSAEVRSLLTLLALIYPDLGHLTSRDRVAEMLVALAEGIDPVRAGMLADRCYVPDRHQPKLQPSQTFSEWHRLGFRATQAYEQLRGWIDKQTTSSSPLLLLDRAIHQFLTPRHRTYAALKTFQELIETAQHYWQIGDRLGWKEERILRHFIELIQLGTVTANPFPPDSPQNSVTLSTIYQYRMARSHHKWQFWLDTGSPLWAEGGAATLFAANLFLQNWNGEIWTLSQEIEVGQIRLARLLQDLLYRNSDQLYLCFSELATNGQMQMGELLPLADLATPILD